MRNIFPASEEIFVTLPKFVIEKKTKPFILHWVHRLLWFWIEAVWLKKHRSRDKHWWSATFTSYICIPFRCSFYNCIMQTPAIQKSTLCIKWFIWFLFYFFQNSLRRAQWQEVQRAKTHFLSLKISFSPLLRSLVSFVPKY